MKHILLTITTALLCNSLHAQITGPDTVYTNDPAQFSTAQKAITYTWAQGDVEVVAAPDTQTEVSSSTLLGQMTYVTMNNDNGNYYSFATNYEQNTINRIEYGNSPLNTPVITSLGTFGLNSNVTDGLDVVRDDAGNWFGIIVGGTQMLRLSFGNSLANLPTATLWTYPSYLAWPHQLMVKNDGNNWIAFAANRSGDISRFDFGSSLNNTPTATELPNVGSYATPSNISLYKQGNNWHMLVTNLTIHSATRLSFGSSLANNSPTGVYLGNLNNLFMYPRGISTLVDCDQQLTSFVMNQQGHLIRLNHPGGNYAATPDASLVTLFPSGTIYNSMTPFTYQGTLYYLATHTSSALYRFKAFDYPAQTVTNYYNPNHTRTFTTPGIYDLTLHCDQGLPQGPSAYCKQIVVVQNPNSVNSVSKGAAITAYPNPSSGAFMLKGMIQSQYKSAQVQVTDLVGRTILSQNITIQNSTIEQAIDIPASYPAGSYFLKVTTPDYSEVLQVSKL